MNQNNASLDEPSDDSHATANPTAEKATAQRLLKMADADLLSRTALRAALYFIDDSPDLNDWKRFINLLLLVLGVGFLVAGIFFFFAYNWNDLHDFAKLGLVQLAILVAAALAHFLGLEKISGQIALTAAALLVGALLALFGQIYQSTADAYTLFIYWAVYILGWVVIGRFAPLWLLLVALLNLGIMLFWDQAGISYQNRFTAESLFLLNTIALLIWEWFSARNVQWMQERWWARIFATAAFAPITIAAIGYILDSSNVEIFTGEITPQMWLVAIAYPLFIVAVWYYYRVQKRDLFILTLLCLSLIGVITTCVGQLFNFNETLMFFILTIVVIVQAGFAALWLRNLGEEA